MTLQIFFNPSASAGTLKKDRNAAEVRQELLQSLYASLILTKAQE